MFTIKKATLADIEVIRTLAAQTFPATYQHILTPEQIDYMIDWMYSSESLRNQMEKEHHIYYIAYEECEPAGYVSIQQEDTDLFHLQKIYVLPYFQKYKLGRQLFQLSSILIMELKTPDLGAQLATELATIALLTNVIRELVALVGAPFICKYFGKLAPISVAGVTSVDVALPSIIRVSGKEMVPLAIFHGLLVDMSVPFFISLFCKL